MAKLEATNPLTGGKFNLLSPWIWIGTILFVVFLLVVFGIGKWGLGAIKGVTGIGKTQGDDNTGALLGGNF